MKFKTPFQDLSRFEKLLWIVSAAVIIISFAFSDKGDYLTVIASLIGVTALVFVAKGYVFGQVLTVIFALFYGIISFPLRYYGEVITYLCMTAPIAVLTIISWIKHPFQGSKEVEVSRLTKRQVVIIIFSAIAVTIAFYFILSALGNAKIIFSTISITTSFVASCLTFFRSPFYAVAYAANDIVLIVLWSLASIGSLSYLPMVLCFVMFLVNDLYGFYNWQIIKKKQELDKLQ